MNCVEKEPRHAHPCGQLSHPGGPGRCGPRPLPPCGLTVSLGVATCPDHAEASAELLQKADVALYAAKKAGRNKVVGPMR